MAKKTQGPAEYILPLYINGLSGRMLRAPSSRKRRREIMLIYGHHAMLERWWGLVENLTPYGNVTMPDLPGFGGMQSFYKIGRKPNIDAYADYLAAFIKLRYKRKRLTILAVSYGFVVVTRMLQRYPEVAAKVDVLVSVVGFMHSDDLVFNPASRKFFKYLARFFATRPISLFIRYCCLNRFVIKHMYARLPNSRRRMLEITPAEFDEAIDLEVRLWQANDVRTHWLTTSQFLDLDNCQQFISLPVQHVVSKKDHYLNNTMVEQHMRQVFSDYNQYIAKSGAHVPSVTADKKAMSVLLPPALKRVLNKKA